MSRSNTNTQRIGINTPQPTPLNQNPVLWYLFEKAKIPMPAAEEYEYHQIEQEEIQQRGRDAEIAYLMHKIYGGDE